jgi:hypothetical protein
VDEEFLGFGPLVVPILRDHFLDETPGCGTVKVKLPDILLVPLAPLAHKSGTHVLLDWRRWRLGPTEFIGKTVDVSRSVARQERACSPSARCTQRLDSCGMILY